MRPTHLTQLFFLLTGLAIVLTGMSPSVAVGQSPEEAPEDAGTETLSGPGAFDVEISFEPEDQAVGTVIVVVRPRYSDLGEPVENAKVSVVLDDALGAPTFRSLALNFPNNRADYRANFLIDRAGAWTARVEILVQGYDPETFERSFMVRQENIAGGLGGTLVFLGVFLVLVGGAAYLTFSSRRKRREAQG